MKTREYLTKEEAKEFFMEFYHGEHNFPSELKAFGQGWAIRHRHGGLATYDFNDLTRLVVMAQKGIKSQKMTKKILTFIGIAAIFSLMFFGAAMFAIELRGSKDKKDHIEDLKRQNLELDNQLKRKQLKECNF